jgi:hypothetical protein
MAGCSDQRERNITTGLFGVHSTSPIGKPRVSSLQPKLRRVVPAPVDLASVFHYYYVYMSSFFFKYIIYFQFYVL